MSAVVSIDARTRSHTREVAVETTSDELDSIVEAAAGGGAALAALSRSERATALTAMADALAADRSAIVAVAPILRARDSEITLSIATVSLFGTLTL